MPVCIFWLAEHFSTCTCMNSKAYTVKTHPHTCPVVIFCLAHLSFPTFMASSINIPFLPCLLIYSSPDKYYLVTMTFLLILSAFA